MGKMRQFRRAIRGCVNKPVLFHMKDGYGAVLLNLFTQIARGERVHDSDIHEVMSAYRTGLAPDTAAGEDDRPEPKRVVIAAGPMLIPGGPGGKAVAIVPVRGVAMYDLEFQPYCFSTLLLGQTMRALANDPEVGTIVLDIDSPGGMVTGTAEAADEIYAARKRKKVVALINPLAASAAYWLASQATEIVSIKSGDVGSIGVFMAHTDCSKFNEMQGMKITYIHAGEYKVEGNPDEPLSDEARAYYQSEIDAVYRDFTKAVARGRGTSVEDVLENYGKGRCMSAPVAKKIGLIDEFMTIEAAMARWGCAAQPKRGRARGEAAEADSDAIETSLSALTPETEQDVAAGSEVFNLVTVEKDGETKAYLGSDWPKQIHIDVTRFNGMNGVAVDGDMILFNAANGEASYQKVAEDGYGGWVCVLRDHSYKPMPTEESTGAEDGAQAAVTSPADPAVTADVPAQQESLVLDPAGFLDDQISTEVSPLALNVDHPSLAATISLDTSDLRKKIDEFVTAVGGLEAAKAALDAAAANITVVVEDAPGVQIVADPQQAAARRRRLALLRQ